MINGAVCYLPRFVCANYTLEDFREDVQMVEGLEILTLLASNYELFANICHALYVLGI